MPRYQVTVKLKTTILVENKSAATPEEAKRAVLASIPGDLKLSDLFEADARELADPRLDEPRK